MLQTKSFRVTIVVPPTRRSEAEICNLANFSYLNVNKIILDVQYIFGKVDNKVVNHRDKTIDGSLFMFNCVNIPLSENVGHRPEFRERFKIENVYLVYV